MSLADVAALPQGGTPAKAGPSSLPGEYVLLHSPQRPVNSNDNGGGGEKAITYLAMVLSAVMTAITTITTKTSAGNNKYIEALRPIKAVSPIVV